MVVLAFPMIFVVWDSENESIFHHQLQLNIKNPYFRSVRAALAHSFSFPSVIRSTHLETIFAPSESFHGSQAIGNGFPSDIQLFCHHLLSLCIVFVE